MPSASADLTFSSGSSERLLEWDGVQRGSWHLLSSAIMLLDIITVENNAPQNSLRSLHWSGNNDCDIQWIRCNNERCTIPEWHAVCEFADNSTIGSGVVQGIHGYTMYTHLFFRQHCVYPLLNPLWWCGVSFIGWRGYYPACAVCIWLVLVVFVG